MVSEQSRQAAGFQHSRRNAEGRVLPTAVKLVIAGGFGVGKTTMVATVSETEPLRTEELLTSASVGVDDTSGLDRKRATTVAMDFGRITISKDYVLYMFGTPGQARFWFMWDEIVTGSLGAVVLADTRRLPECFATVDYFERHNIPFIVAVNQFDGERQYELAEIRLAMQVHPKVPVMVCDPRNLESSKQALLALVAHAMAVRGVAV